MMENNERGTKQHLKDMNFKDKHAIESDVFLNFEFSGSSSSA